MEKGCLAVLVFGVPTPLIMIMITKRTKIEHLITMVITKYLGASRVLVLGVPTPPSWELTQALSTVGSAR